MSSILNGNSTLFFYFGEKTCRILNMNSHRKSTFGESVLRNKKWKTAIYK